MIEEMEFKEIPNFANELRIGNYYAYLHEEHETFHKADADFIKIQSEYDADPYADQFSRGWWARPVPLTPEVLEKCPEIKKEYGDFFFEHKGIRYKVEQQDDWWVIGIKPDAKTTTYFIWYLYNLHQFQNAFYALTGTELTITL